jgi:hypothetical protein
MTERAREVTAVRVLELDLGGDPAVARPRPFAADDPALRRVAARSGTALALALFARDAADPASDAPLVVGVGECVRRGLPTAARAGVSSRSPLSGRLADGQVGGDLGRRLASVADALVLRGRCAEAGALLVVDARGRARLERARELRGASPRAFPARPRCARVPPASAACASRAWPPAATCRTSSGAGDWGPCSRGAGSRRW